MVFFLFSFKVVMIKKLSLNKDKEYVKQYNRVYRSNQKKQKSK